MLIFILHSTSDVGQIGQWTWTPSTTCLQPKNEMLIFQIHSTCDDQSSWSMDSNPICHTSPTKKMKCSFLDYVQLLMLARLVNGLKPHPPPLFSHKNEMLLFWITFNFWWLARFVDGLELHPPPVSSQKMKCSYFDFAKLLMIGRAVQWTWTPSTTPLHPKKWNASFLDYAQLLMIGWAEWWTQTPSTIPLQPKKWNAHFWITFNFWWLAGLVNGLKPHPPPVSCQKNEILIFVLHWILMISRAGWWTRTPSTTSLQQKLKCSFLDYVQLLMISWVCRWTWTPSTTPLQPKKWNAHFWVMFNFWWLVGLFDELKPHLPPLSSQ